MSGAIAARTAERAADAVLRQSAAAGTLGSPGAAGRVHACAFDTAPDATRRTRARPT